MWLGYSWCRHFRASAAKRAAAPTSSEPAEGDGVPCVVLGDGAVVAVVAVAGAAGRAVGTATSTIASRRMRPTDSARGSRTPQQLKMRAFMGACYARGRE